MAKGFSGGGLPGNMNNLMKQAQKMQKQIQELQDELDKRIFEISSGGGAVKISMTGKKEVTAITLSPEVVDPDDIEMLQDLLLAAVNEAVRQVDETVSREMGGITGGMGGMGLPGMF